MTARSQFNGRSIHSTEGRCDWCGNLSHNVLSINVGSVVSFCQPCIEQMLKRIRPMDPADADRLKDLDGLVSEQRDRLRGALLACVELLEGTHCYDAECTLAGRALLRETRPLTDQDITDAMSSVPANPKRMCCSVLDGMPDILCVRERGHDGSHRAVGGRQWESPAQLPGDDTCPVCHGAVKMDDYPCESCGGSGKLPRAEGAPE